MKANTYPELCHLAGYTVEEAERLGLCRAELIQIIEGYKIAA